MLVTEERGQGDEDKTEENDAKQCLRFFFLIKDQRFCFFFLF